MFSAFSRILHQNHDHTHIPQFAFAFFTKSPVEQIAKVELLYISILYNAFPPRFGKTLRNVGYTGDEARQHDGTIKRQMIDPIPPLCAEAGQVPSVLRTHQSRTNDYSAYARSY
jgi:hypothetical protein